MAIQKEKGIVILSRDIGDSDRMFSLLGESWPRMNFICKGIRKSKRRPIAATEVGSWIEIHFYDQKEKEWKSIKEISLVNRFDTLKSSYLGTLFVQYLTELTSLLHPDGESNSYLYNLLMNSLVVAEESPNPELWKLLLPFFKIRALSELGHFPSEFVCATCGDSIFEKQAAFFDLDHREFLCSSCHTVVRNQILLLKNLSNFQQRKFGLLRKMDWDASHIRDMDFFLNQFLRALFGKDLRTSYDFYKALGSEIST